MKFPTILTLAHQRNKFYSRSGIEPRVLFPLPPLPSCIHLWASEGSDFKFEIGNGLSGFSRHGDVKSEQIQVRISRTTFPCTSVSRMSRPPKR